MAMLNNAPNLVVLSLNTNFMKINNSKPVADDCGQLDWLESKLIEAEEQHQGVFIVGHIPPNIDNQPSGPTQIWVPQYQERFWKLLDVHSSVIKAVVYGHRHTEETYIGSPVLTMNCGAISPVYNNNPNFRVVQYHRTTGDITDWSQVYTDLYQSNVYNRAEWKIAYSFSQAYPGFMSSSGTITASSMEQLTKCVLENNAEATLWTARRLGMLGQFDKTSYCFMAAGQSVSDFNNCINNI